MEEQENIDDTTRIYQVSKRKGKKKKAAPEIVVE